LSGILVVGAARFTWLQFLLGTRQAAFALSGQQLLADASLVHHRYDDRFLRYKNVERVARDVGVMWVLREPDIFRDSEENCFWDPPGFDWAVRAISQDLPTSVREAQRRVSCTYLSISASAA
jgi:hypothetical protein